MIAAGLPFQALSQWGREAQSIADYYQRIISSIEEQIDQQGGW
jgi:hypothetical protein